MTTKDSEVKKPLKLNRPGRLELKKTVETGQVRQSFSHGRTKAVTVEVKRTRSFERGASGRMTEIKTPQESFEAGLAEAAEQVEHEIEQSRALTEDERAARLRALESAKRDEERRQIEDERRQREAEEAARRKAQEAEALREAEQETEKHRAELEERRRIEEEAQRQLEAEAEAKEKDKAPAPAKAPKADGAEQPAAEEEPVKVKRKGPPAKASTARRSGEERRRHGKLTITQALAQEDGIERVRSLASVRRQREREKRQQREAEARRLPHKVIREVVIPETITVQELANRMAERGSEVIKALMKMDVMATITQTIDADTAELVVGEFGHKSKRVSAADVELGLVGEADDLKDLKPRPPVVTVMGHVDHGKTSLLDALRETDVAGHEAGGITQHIGAYQVTLEGGGKVTFIDTPGHAAFTEMRSRGANVTDVVILVVAADDGIKEQTVEAINHAKAAEVPIVVAVNKMDKPGANADRVKQELLNHDLVVEDMGGEVLAIPVSAKDRTNLDKLVEAILLQSELLELSANPDRAAEGVVIEAKLEQGRGAVATVLVQRGTLRVGDIFVTGREWGRVRALIDDRGENTAAAGPSVPVEVLGLNGTPLAGDDFVVVDNEARARDIADFRRQRTRNEGAAASRVSLEQLISKIKEGETRHLPVVIKSDVQGSLEAIVGALQKLGNEEVAVQILHTGVGGINESDITLARASDATVIGFNVRANPQARDLARRDNVEIRYYSIIYDVVDEMKAGLSGMLAPSREEKFLGYAEIRQVFSVSKAGKVAGCMVTEGTVKRGAKVRLLRDDVVIHDGTLKTLRRFKDEVKDVREGYECGMAFENYQDIQVVDKIECYEIEEVARAL